jgi:hypothetical protein
VNFYNPDAQCIHVLGQNYGQTKGALRQQLVASGLRPYFLLQNALGSLSAERLFSGNRVGVPSMHAAKSISGQASRAGRRHDDLDRSLTILAEELEARDRGLAAAQLLNARQKRAVFGLVFGVSSKPLNVLLTTEGTCRIYAKMLDSEPGYWSDATGNLTQKARLSVHVAVPQTVTRAQVIFNKGLSYQSKKDLLHFMLVLAGDGHALTVVEIISSDQTATNLVRNLFAFEGVVESAVGSRVGKPRRVTTDCGQNVLVAMCTWANGESVKEVMQVYCLTCS